MKWLEAYREKRNWRMLLGQLQELETRNMLARARMIGRLSGPDKERQMEIAAADVALRQQIIDLSRNFVAESEAAIDLPLKLSAEVQIACLRSLHGLGDPSWSKEISAIETDRKRAVQFVAQLKALSLANRPDLSTEEQHQIDEAVRKLSRSVRKHKSEVKKAEREQMYQEFLVSNRQIDHQLEALMRRHTPNVMVEQSQRELESILDSESGDVKSMKFEPLSAAFAKRVLVRHPQWSKYARHDQHIVDGLTVFTFRVDFPSANPNVLEPLSVSVGLDKIICLSWFKMPNGGRWDWDDIYYYERPQKDFGIYKAGFDRVIDWLDCLMNEEIVACYFDDGNGCRYCPHDAAELKALKRGEVSTVIRSWHGTHDQD